MSGVEKCDEVEGIMYHVVQFSQPIGELEIQREARPIELIPKREIKLEI